MLADAIGRRVRIEVVRDGSALALDAVPRELDA
jgi:hypothetical protein